MRGALVALMGMVAAVVAAVIAMTKAATKKIGHEPLHASTGADDPGTKMAPAFASREPAPGADVTALVDRLPTGPHNPSLLPAGN